MSKHQWIEIPAPLVGNNPTAYSKAFTKRGCKAWVTRNVHRNGALRWQLSISRADRYPTWDEIKDARYALLPDDCTVGMLLPPKREYVNLHPNCFHLHEVLET